MLKTILVVDDCDILRLGARAFLMKAGYAVIEACDGKEALSRLDEGRVDLVISDLNMPVMDGISLIKAMKCMPVHESIPVVILSSENSEEKMKEGLLAGASAWMIKPLQPKLMLASIPQLVDA